MKTHKLLSFVPKKRGGWLFWLGLLLLAVAAADQFFLKLLGSLTMVAWGLGGLFILIAILLRVLPSSSQSGSVQIEKDGIIVKQGSYELPIPFEDIQTVSGGKISQHHSLKELDGREKAAVKPYFNQTQVFIELYEETEELKQARQHMPSFMFGTKQVGLLVMVEGDWIPLERDIDEARMAWMDQLKNIHLAEHRAKYPDPWDIDDDFEDEDDDDEWLP